MPSWLMPVLVLAPLALVAVAIGARTRRIDLERMHLEADERALFDEAGCKVRIRTPARNRTEILPGAVARLTSRRLILAQKYLLGSDHLVRSVFLFAGAVPDIDRREGVFKSFENYRVDPASVRLDEATTPPTLHLEARPEIDSPAVYPVELRLSCPRAAEIARTLAPVKS